jgi:hypothetical protein
VAVEEGFEDGVVVLKARAFSFPFGGILLSVVVGMLNVP